MEFLPGQEQCTKPALIFVGVKLVSNLAGWFVSIEFTLLLFPHVNPCKANLGGRPLLPGQATCICWLFRDSLWVSSMENDSLRVCFPETDADASGTREPSTSSQSAYHYSRTLFLRGCRSFFQISDNSLKPPRAKARVPEELWASTRRCVAISTYMNGRTKKCGGWGLCRGEAVHTNPIGSLLEITSVHVWGCAHLI